MQLENADALYIIRTRDSTDSFFYCDPPYYNSDMGHYKGYTRHDFENLLKTLASIKGKFLLSSYPSKLLEEYTVSHRWETQMHEQFVTVNAKNQKEKKKTEVLTANYLLQGDQHQMILF